MQLRRFRALAAAAAIALGASAAGAGTTAVDFASDMSLKGLASFNGTATYDSSNGKLTIVINNSTPSTKGGFLTGLALDTKAGITAAYEDVDGGHKPNINGFDEARNKKGIINTGKLGKYTAGADLDGKWNSGKPQRGVAAGSSGTFVFDIHGTNAATLTAADFFSGPANKEIVAAFKGMAKHKSDQAGGALSSALRSLDLQPTNNPPGSQGSDLPNDGLLPPPGPNTGNTGDNGNGGNPGGNPGGTPGVVGTAVPLPPAAWMGLATFGLMGASTLKRKFRAVIA